MKNIPTGDGIMYIVKKQESRSAISQDTIGPHKNGSVLDEWFEEVNRRLLLKFQT